MSPKQPSNWLYLLFVPLVIYLAGLTVILFYQRHEQSLFTSSLSPSALANTLAVRCPASVDPANLIPCNDDSVCETKCGPLHTCYQVRQDYLFKESVTAKEPVLVPDSPASQKGWCLPTKTTTKLKCNELTGTPVLTQLTDTQNAWTCHCKYPFLFQNAGLYGDCTDEVACGARNPPLTGTLVCPQSMSKYCKPGEPWVKNPTWNPLQGECKCPSGLKFLDRSSLQEKLCVADSCTPGKSADDPLAGCECPPKVKTGEGEWVSYIRCPADVLDEKVCNNGNNQCVPDPCNPSGYWDGGGCVCNGVFQSVDDATSLTGKVCNDLCGTTGGKCGNRGTCNPLTGYCKVYTCISAWQPDTAINNQINETCSKPRFSRGHPCKAGFQCLSGTCSPKYSIFGGDYTCS